MQTEIATNEGDLPDIDTEAEVKAAAKAGAQPKTETRTGATQ